CGFMAFLIYFFLSPSAVLLSPGGSIWQGRSRGACATQRAASRTVGLESFSSCFNFSLAHESDRTYGLRLRIALISCWSVVFGPLLSRRSTMEQPKGLLGSTLKFG